MASFHCTSRRCDGTIAASSIATRAYFLPRPGSSVLCSVQNSITPPVVTSRRFFWLSDRVMIGARTLLASRHTSSKYFSFGANHATGRPASMGRTRRLMSSSVLPHRLPHTSTLNLRASWMTSSWAGWGRRSLICAVEIIDVHDLDALRTARLELIGEHAEVLTDQLHRPDALPKIRRQVHDTHL